jgi:UDP-glucose:glycoprotein glucosyltransferase
MTGNQDTASIQVVVAIDPASEIAQRWIPILKVLSELDGVHLKLFMNPGERIQELPVKRFYRHVLAATPSSNWTVLYAVRQRTSRAYRKRLC